MINRSLMTLAERGLRAKQDAKANLMAAYRRFLKKTEPSKKEQAGQDVIRGIFGKDATRMDRGRIRRQYSGVSSSVGQRLRLVVCVLLFTLSLCRYWIGYDPSRTVPQRPESFKLAHNIVTDGQFANPFATLNTGPSAHLAPAFPFFLALLIKAFGEGAAGAYAFKISAVLAVSLLLALFPLISEALRIGLLNGVIAAFLWLIVKVPTSPYWEGIYASLLVVLAICSFREYVETSTPDIRLTVLLGCVMGMLMLLIPSSMPVLTGYVIWALYMHKRAFVKPRHLIMVIAPALMTLPWTSCLTG